jgi:hypothetical protein
VKVVAAEVCAVKVAVLSSSVLVLVVAGPVRVDSVIVVRSPDAVAAALPVDSKVLLATELVPSDTVSVVPSDEPSEVLLSSVTMVVVPSETVSVVRGSVVELSAGMTTVVLSMIVV